MTYKIEVDPEARDQIRGLPPALLNALGEVMSMLELTPWHGAPFVAANPDGSVRQIVFGHGGTTVVVYMILEHQLRVDVLKVMWVG
ncbi:MAG: hypothetical protein GEV28_09915 [Actinophytocola sp.]|uniref:type II toxin-antitoxin system RelE family toxin n=1 Tax=Actinophytocola sp. TaxID=1872138 RepID=UPI00132C275A|nr:hypothetical protein [Actinophytocola sp.]MPZ80682.1 hypothetical protein [Actinophytocola sp.]